ncbi:hypothetical protein [Pseudomonas fragi]|uniref:hypothetical protein n=1 Tax=Pseudomonas fragi TaxID=296 RepID=UPI001F343382|nr:hypothetical protein [Pseudomonas fragi]MCF6763793.1 hypothetical protein [Pseudomonas fragi]
MKGTLALLLMLTALLGISEMPLAAEPSAKPRPNVDTAQEQKARPFKRSLDDILEELPNIKRDLKVVKATSTGRERKMVSLQHGTASATIVFDGSDMSHLDEIMIVQFVSRDTTLEDARAVDNLTSTLIFSVFGNPAPSSLIQMTDFMNSELKRQTNILRLGGKPKAAHKVWRDQIRLTTKHQLFTGGTFMSSYILKAI